MVADRSFVGNSEMKTDKLEPVVKLKKGAIYTEARAHATLWHCAIFIATKGA